MICHYKLNIVHSCWNNISRINIHPLIGKQSSWYVFLLKYITDQILNYAIKIDTTFKLKSQLILTKDNFKSCEVN